MSVFALISGTLFRSVESRVSKNGKPFVTATVRIKDGDGSQFIHIVAFSETVCAELLRLKDGDSLSLQGPLKAEIYEKNGEHRISLSLVVDQVLALRQPPKGHLTKAPDPAQQTRPRQARCSGSWAPGAGPSDDIPF